MGINYHINWLAGFQHHQQYCIRVWPPIGVSYVDGSQVLRWMGYSSGFDVQLMLVSEAWESWRDLRMGIKKTALGILRFLMAEIRRSPVEVGRLSHYLQGFSTIPGGAGFQPSTVLVMVMVKKMMIKIDEDDEILFTRSNIAKRHH